MRSASEPQTPKIQPTKPQGSLFIGGKKVEINVHSIKMNPGLPAKQVVKKLREESKKSLFSMPALSANG